MKKTPAKMWEEKYGKLREGNLNSLKEIEKLKEEIKELQNLQVESKSVKLPQESSNNSEKQNVQLSQENINQSNSIHDSESEGSNSFTFNLRSNLKRLFFQSNQERSTSVAKVVSDEEPKDKIQELVLQVEKAKDELEQSLNEVKNRSGNSREIVDEVRQKWQIFLGRQTEFEQSREKKITDLSQQNQQLEKEKKEHEQTKSKILEAFILNGKKGKGTESDVFNIIIEELMAKIKQLEQEITSKKTELEDLLANDGDYKELIEKIDKEVESWNESSSKENIEAKINDFLKNQNREEKTKELIGEILKLKWELISNQKEIKVLEKKIKELKNKLKEKKKKLEDEIKEKEEELEKEKTLLIGQANRPKEGHLKHLKEPIEPIGSILEKILRFHGFEIRQNNSNYYKCKREEEERKIDEDLRDQLGNLRRINKEFVELNIQLEGIDNNVQTINNYGKFAGWNVEGDAFGIGDNAKGIKEIVGNQQRTQQLDPGHIKTITPPIK